MTPKFDLSSRTNPAIAAGDLAGLMGGTVAPVSQTAKGAVALLPRRLLRDYDGHTFRVTVDEELMQLSRSIKENGILTPLLVRPCGSEYEIISGHRRCKAASMVGIYDIPCIIEDMDDDTADIRMVETNRYREHFLPSERAFSYQKAAAALNRKGRRSDLYGVDPTQPTVEEVTGENARSVRNWIRLTKLVHELLTMVDIGTVPVRAGVELSYLYPREQEAVGRYLQEAGGKLSLLQAATLREYSAELDAGEHGTMTYAGVCRVLSGEPTTQAPLPPAFKLRKPQLQQISEYIPEEPRNNDPTAYIIRALQHYHEHENGQIEEL